MPSEWASGAGAEHGLGRAAGLGAVGLRVGPELDRDADDLGAFLAGEQRGDGAVDAAGHGDGTRRRGRLASRLRRGRHPAREASGERRRWRARWRASVASWAAWRLAGVRPPIAASTVVDADPGGVEDRRAVDHLGDGGGRRRASRRSPRRRS